ncbi:hypothetical protein ACIQOU_30130 [Streptomyces sp. NPDC091279]|uniref:hypothetical protein n=1 Tax=unclassified Streptomyces TaxID=2593676 RepID=UPI00382CC5EF
MTARTPGDRERRRNLADASNTPMPALAGLLRRVPSQRCRSHPLTFTDLPADSPTQIGPER